MVTLTRGIALPHDTDNATNHIRNLTRDIFYFYFLKNDFFKKIKKITD